jgi:hypothetical protein
MTHQFLIKIALLALLSIVYLVDVVAIDIRRRHFSLDPVRALNSNYLDIWSERQLGVWWALRATAYASALSICVASEFIWFPENPGGVAGPLLGMAIFNTAKSLNRLRECF